MTIIEDTGIVKKLCDNALKWPKMLLRRVGLDGTEDVRLYLVQELDGLRREFLAIGGAGLAD